MSKDSQNSKRIAIVAGLRTPFVKQATYFTDIPAVELGSKLIRELMLRIDLDPKLIEQLVFGQVIQMPRAPNIAREIVLASGLLPQTDAYSVTRACATSFQSVANIANEISLNNIKIGIAGGADSSSVLPIGVSDNLARSLLAFSKAKSFKDKVNIITKLKFKELLPVSPSISEYSTGLTMGQVAEQMAKTYAIPRADQDALAFRSHQNANNAWDNGKLNSEVFTYHNVKNYKYVSKDNTIRPDANLESYRNLKPVFDKKYGSVTAATSSPLTDGASAVVLMREDCAKALGYKPIGYIVNYSFCAIDVYQDMLLGPAYATPKVLAKANMNLNDIDLIEMHEAFASQVLVNIKMLGSDKFAKEKLGLEKAVGDIDMSKFNVLGGSIAYGHPFAATGTRLITQLCNELKRRGGGIGLTTACAAGGLGAAMIIEVD